MVAALSSALDFVWVCQVCLIRLLIEMRFAAPNTALEPTASPPLAWAFARFGACRFSRRGSALDR